MSAAHSGWSAFQYDEAAMEDFKESTGIEFDLHKELDILKSLPKFKVSTGTERPVGRNAAQKRVKDEKEIVKIEAEKVNALKQRNSIPRKLKIEFMLTVAKALEPSPQKTKIMDMVFKLSMDTDEENPTDDDSISNGT